MSNDIIPDSLCTNLTEPLSKSVTKVQTLPNISAWNDSNALLRDFLSIFFTKKATFFGVKQRLPDRKRVSILTPTDILLIYETNCTGYSFAVSEAVRMDSLCYRKDKQQLDEKTCTITLKYKFGYVNLVLKKHQIPVWRQTLFAIFEEESFNENIVNNLSLYTARDEDIDDALLTNRSHLDYTNSVSVISLKSSHGFMNLTPSEADFTVDSTQIENSSLKTNSNRSSTCLPLSMRSNISTPSLCSNTSKTASVDNNANKNMISIRQGSHAVSYLAKKFEAKLGIGRKTEQKTKEQPSASSPLEILFPPPPSNQQKTDEFEIQTDEKPRRMSILSSILSKKTMKHPEEIKTELV
ncbi:hypothetical protein GCK72_005578 [Caenorhabditis remanei]|uniref:DUF7778 domain-containing protein n=1 Tax=Caenorhabditis remanei TaxID=31234 RepID=A0A6A5HE57_CAERE|nr:hypothetical protein GCK72_005578 [Caenorhabditis remanei]KAF1765625.1 hypothetical protein GCK72_005578 [Caenorhabditis remanei]